MADIYVNHPLDDVERRRALFGGALVLESATEASRALCAAAEGEIRAALGDDPQRTQFHIDVPDFIERVAPLKSRFTNADETKRLVRNLLSASGCDLERTYFDVPRLRVVPSDGYLVSGVSYAYKAHRDIWYSSPRSQVNWWSPVFDVEPGAGMAMYPGYFDRAILNSSAEFDYGRWQAEGRSAAVQQVTTDARPHPLPTEPIDVSSEQRLALGGGDLLLFSACQLHMTSPNASGRTRFSIDFRTVHLDDLREGRGGPDVDAAATGTTLGDFLRASDLAPLPTEDLQL